MWVHANFELSRYLLSDASGVQEPSVPSVHDGARHERGQPNNDINAQIHPPQDFAVRHLRMKLTEPFFVVDIATVCVGVDGLIAQTDQEYDARGRNGEDLGDVGIVVTEGLRRHLASECQEHYGHRQQTAADR